MKIKIKAIILNVAFCFLSFSSFSQSIEENFKTPPNSAKPRVWWHWMNGNISKEGIQKDLEWMQRIGIGGFQNFDANLMTPVVVPKKLVFMTPEWKDAFKFTTELADKKGLEMAIAGSPGWSVTGGPWVEPKDGMKKYVWTETKIQGGKVFNGKLTQPSDVIGVFQNIGIEEGFSGGFVGKQPLFYQDAAVIAYRLPKTEKSLAEFKPKVTSSGGNFTLENLTDGNLNKGEFLPPLEIGQEIWIQYEFETPQTFKALSIVGASHGMMEQFNGSPQNRSLKVSDDGVNFKEIVQIHGSSVPQTTVNFTPTTAKYFRFAYKTLAAELNPIAAMMGGAAASKPSGVNVAEFNLFNTTRIDKAEDKAGFLPHREEYITAKNDINDAISENDIINVSDKMQVDGTLNWTAPEGNWNIIRLGYSLTGRQNHPASPEATGLEVDKLDKEAVRKYINTYLDLYKDATGGLMGEKGLQYMILDSYEAGHMNWTKDFPAEFQKRRGYNLLKWIPVLTGRVVKSVEESEKFLWDFRKTIGEMISENHYDVIGEELHKRGMKRYTESHEGGRIYLADGMDVKRNTDIPMAAMWTPGSLTKSEDEEVRSEADIREAASVANIYGQNIVAGESMTSVGRAFQEYPERLKRTADLEMASGLNRFVIHTSVHQPLETAPGFSLGPFGQYFTRHETWAEAGGKAWMEYLGRSSYLLQQGKNVADILYLYGENTNITLVCKDKLPTIPAGFEFDFVNSTALINEIVAKDGKLTTVETRHALSNNRPIYDVLALDESTKYMTLSVLKKIQSLVNLGVRLVGKKPIKSPSLSDNNDEFQKIANEVWAKMTVLETFDSKQKQYPETSLLESMPFISPILTNPDVIFSETTSKILYRHRQIQSNIKKGLDTDIYWLNNRNINPTTATVSFRVLGKTPELWNAQTGKTENLSYQIKDGRTIIPLKFESWDAYFIVFKDKAEKKQIKITEKKTTNSSSITGTWKINVGEKTIQLDKLKSLSENVDTDIKYFSGTAIYQNTFQISSIDNLAQYMIDLGDVKNVAEVFINGINVGTAWKQPYKMPITESIKEGENNILIKVTNTWVNRLIGDAQPNAVKTTFTTMPFYRGQEPLESSGLLSEVKIITIK